MSSTGETTQSNPDHPFIVPVFAGGGTRLSAHVGVATALEELKIPFQHIVGVSGGSIVAALMAVGKSNEEIKALALNVDFKRFKGFSPYQLFFYGGLSSGMNFERWMDQQLSGAVFGDLPLNLHIVATDVQTGRPVVFDQERTPGLKVAEAVRYSMGIPLLFSFKLYQGQVLVDGSILAEEVLRRDWAGNGSPVCFFRIRSNAQGLEQEGRSRGKKPPLLPTFLAMVIRSFMMTISREFINDAYWHSTIVIDSGEISPVEFGLSKAQKVELFRQGYETTMQYLPEKFLKNAPASFRLN